MSDIDTVTPVLRHGQHGLTQGMCVGAGWPQHRVLGVVCGQQLEKPQGDRQEKCRCGVPGHGHLSRQRHGEGKQASKQGQRGNTRSGVGGDLDTGQSKR